MTNTLLINPMDDGAKQLIIQFSETTTYIDSFIPLSTVINGQEQEVAITLPVFVFTKPRRNSKKNPEIIKPEGKYCAVYEPMALGIGAFGGVYPVLGTWKIEGGRATFKTKKPGVPQRVVKSNPKWEIYPNGNPNLGVSESYATEQSIGFWVDYMGFKYVPTQTKDRSFLLMNRQKGESLSGIISDLENNPNFLTITQKLQITVALLHEAKSKLHQARIPVGDDKDLAYIVHSDIKPDNVIIDLGPPIVVRYIDFGLSKLSSAPHNLIQGTPKYMEPQLLEPLPVKNNPPGINRLKQYTDQVSDTFSIARVIAELWGDRSRDSVCNRASLLQQNKNIPLTGLLNGITGLTEDEQQQLNNLISKMNQYDPATRLSETEALEEFEKLLNKRLKIDEEIVEANLIKSIEELSDWELFDILSNERFLPEFLKKLKSNPEAVKLLVNQMNFILASLSDTILEKLKEVGMDLSNTTVIEDGLSFNELSLEQVAKLAKFGAPVPESLLENHLNSTENSIDWIAKCRTLYHLTQNSELILQQYTGSSLVAKLYCKHFLKLNNPALDVYHKILIDRHSELIVVRDETINTCKQILLKLFSNRPELQSLLSSDLLNDNSDELYLMESSILKQLGKSLSDLDKLSDESVISGYWTDMNCRLLEINRLKDQLTTVILGDPDRLLIEGPLLHTKVKQIKRLDRLVEGIRFIADECGISISKADFDTCYANLNDDSRERQLNERLEFLRANKELLTENKEIQQKLTEQMDLSSMQSLYAASISACKLEEADKLVEIIQSSKDLYTKISSNYDQITWDMAETLYMPTNRNTFYQQLKDYLLKTIMQPDINDIAYIMERISKFLSQNMAIKRLIRDNLSTMSRGSITSFFRYLYQHSDGNMNQFIDTFVDKTNHWLEFELIDSAFLSRFHNFYTHIIQCKNPLLTQQLNAQFFDVLSHYLNDSINDLDNHKKSWGDQIDALINQAKLKDNKLSVTTSQQGLFRTIHLGPLDLANENKRRCA